MNPRTLCLTSLLLAVVAPVSAEPDLSAYPAVDVDMSIKRVSEHVHYAEGTPGMATENAGFISNAGFIVTDDSVVVVDALGSPSLAAKLYGEIRAITDKPVSHVIVTHYHADHIYGLQVFKDAGARILAPKGANAYLNAPQAAERLEERRFSLSPWVNEDTRLVAPDRMLTGTETLSVGGLDLTVSVVGSAHSDGDLTVYVEQDDVLFSGDIIFEGRVPWLGDADTRAWLTELREMESTDLAALIPGHGPAADNPNEAIALTRRYLADVRAKMGAAVDNFTPFAEAYEAADWSAWRDLPAFEAAHRRNAYQVYLSLEAEQFQ